MIRYIEKGEPLSRAITRSAGRYFPGFYLAGIARAEQKGCLDTALPLLARQLESSAEISTRRKAAWGLVRLRLLAMVPLAFLMWIFIMPVFRDMYEGLGGSANNRPAIYGIVMNLLQIALVCAAVWWVISKNRKIREKIIFLLPVYGADYRRYVMGDLACGMAAFLRQGEDVVSAAKWNLKATRSPWLRARIDRFIATVSGGANWAEAWNSEVALTPFEQWLINNASLREDAHGGFEFLAEWLQQEVEFTTRKIEKWADPLAVIILGIVVGLIAWSAFFPMFRMALLIVPR